MQASRLVQRRARPAPTDLCAAFCSLYIAARGLNTSAIHRAAGGSNNATPNPMHSAPAGTTTRGDRAAAQITQAPAQPPAAPVAVPGGLTVSEQMKQSEVAAKAQKELEKRKKDLSVPVQGSLANNNIFDFTRESNSVSDPLQGGEEEEGGKKEKPGTLVPISKRNPQYMEQELNPRPDARARWLRKRVITNIRKRGRITREMHLARTERKHTVQSHFFKTSIKKLAPLARQIAGKSVDEAIVQMRFSVKKAAKQVLRHLIHARNEAIVIRGMGLSETTAQPASAVNVQKQTVESLIAQAFPSQLVNKQLVSESKPISPAEQVFNSQTADKTEPTPTNPPAAQTLLPQTVNEPKPKSSVEKIFYSQPADTTKPTTTNVPTSLAQPSPSPSPAEIVNPSNTPRLKTQNPDKSIKAGFTANPTDIYVAQAWVNRGRYSKKMMARARGRGDIQRPPRTGITVLLQEEKTRTRERYEKEMKSIKKRLSGKLWTQLPDRPVTRQSQYVLW